MRARFLLVSLGTLLLLLACVAPSKMIRKEGDKTIVVLQGVEFVVPPGFDVIDIVRSMTSDTVNDAMVIMAKSEAKFYTVLIFSRQKALEDAEFIKLDLKMRFPNGLFFDDDLKFIDQAATYIARMHMARRLYLEKPLCKVLTGYRYTSSGTVRFRFDIYQNFAKEDPFKGCCGKDKRKPLPDDFVKTARKSEVEIFRNFALGLIKDNVRWP